MLELESSTSSQLQCESLWNLATTFAPADCQPINLPVLVSDLSVRVSTDTFMEGKDEDNLKEFTCGVFTNLVRIQDTQGPTVAPSSPLSNRPEIFYLLL